MAVTIATGAVKTKREGTLGYLLPALLLIAFFFIVPVLMLLMRSVLEPEVGLQNYEFLLFEYDRAERYFPFVLVTLVVPTALVLWPRTRRFGLYMIIGMVVTALVVGGVAAVVLWYLVTRDG